MKRTPFLTREDEAALMLRWRDHGDEKAMHKVVLAHMPMADKTARFYAKRSIVPLEDLQSEGYCGLLIAARKFDPDAGYRFSTYASQWVKAMVADFIVRHSLTVKGSQSTAARGAFFRGEGVVQVFSLDVPITVGEGDNITFADTLVSEEPGPDQNTEASIDTERINALLHKAVGRLPERQQTIVRRRYLKDEPDTLTIIAEDLGRSKERIRQVEAQALASLAIPMRKFAEVVA